MSERSHHHNPAAHSRSRPTREKGAVPFQLIGHHQLRTPRFHSPPCLGNGGSWIAGSRRMPLFPRKEGQARAELPHREPLTMHANRPLKDIACVLHAQTKDATVVCVIGCQITRTRIHTLPKRLASARHSRVRKLYSYQIHSARFKQTSQWRRKSWWCILPAALILWYAGSDVMGCRRPTGGVFSYVSSDRVTLRAFPVATPRGRSVSFPWRGTGFSASLVWSSVSRDPSDIINVFVITFHQFNAHLMNKMYFLKKMYWPRLWVIMVMYLVLYIFIYTKALSSSRIWLAERSVIFPLITEFHSACSIAYRKCHGGHPNPL